MSVGWSGADPSNFADGGSAHYELGTEYTAAADVTIKGVRVWGHAASASRADRAGKIWSTGGSLLATAAMPSVLAPGWTTHELDADVEVPAGTTVIVSYDVDDTYGAVSPTPGFPRISADTLVTAVRGRRDLTTPDIFPSGTTTGAFYGIDIDYEAGLVGNNRPTVGLAVTAVDLVASAILTITDEVPATVTYAIEWGDGQTSAGLTSLGPHSHTYAVGGLYAVMVTATDAGGLTDSAAAALAVIGPAQIGLTGKRARLAAALSTVADVTGYASRPATGRPGDAWPLLGPLERADGTAFIATWRVRVLLPQAEVAAMTWWDAHWPSLFEALEPEGFIDRAEPIVLPAAGGEQFAIEITLRAEE